MCQLSESLTEHKYRGNYEKTGKIITQYSTQSGLDALHYYQLILFCFITGNADMHLKNFSMMEKMDGAFCLSPAYDLVSTHLVIKNETEQMSLSLNGKKNKISKNDLDTLGLNLQLTEKQIENCYKSFGNRFDRIQWWIDNSFIPTAQKDTLMELISKRIELLHK